MNIKVLTYNLRQGAAAGELPGLIETHRPSVVCLQECVGTLPDEIGDMTLLDSARLGSVKSSMYYRNNELRIVNHEKHSLPLALYERALRDERRRLIVAQFENTETSEQICVASLHTSHLLASNRNRRAQIGRALSLAGATVLPTIVAGDFNYPWFRVGLERVVSAHGFSLAAPENATLYNGIFSGWFDYVAYNGINLVSIEAQEFGASDHASVIAEFES